jgi:hypothetical protein
MPPRRIEQNRNGARRKQARRATAQKDADHFAAGHFRGLRLEIALQRFDVASLLEIAMERVRVEIAIGTLAHTPGKMHVKRKRWSFEHSDILPAGRRSGTIAP